MTRGCPTSDLLRLLASYVRKGQAREDDAVHLEKAADEIDRLWGVLDDVAPLVDLGMRACPEPKLGDWNRSYLAYLAVLNSAKPTPSPDPPPREETTHE